MPQAYSNPTRADDPHALPDVEYFRLYDLPNADLIREGYAPGWYWWACFPGCMPDSEPFGPFATEQECIADFTDGAE